jgi:competence protein ComEA
LKQNWFVHCLIVVVYGAVTASSLSSAGAKDVAKNRAAAETVQDRFPESAGKPELVKVCGSCHGAEIVLANLKTPSEWADTLQNMVQQGADATPEEWRLIEQYLDAKLAMILINKSGADDLQLTMEVTPDVAAAIVKYRQDQGAFKSVEDVKKVPGMDAARMEAQKNRFVF